MEQDEQGMCVWTSCFRELPCIGNLENVDFTECEEFMVSRQELINDGIHAIGLDSEMCQKLSYTDTLKTVFGRKYKDIMML